MFSELTGNTRVKEALKRMITSDRLPGALLFAGEEGVGKKRFALEVARTLNCRTPRDGEACGKCPSCVRTAKLNYPEREDAEEWTQIIWTDHPDVGLVIAPKRVLRVEQMRQIEKEANFRPFEGKARIFLIDEADKLKDAGKLDEAVAKFNEALGVDPNYALAHSALAVVLQKLGRHDEAIAHARKVCEIEPNDPFSFTALSVTYQRAYAGTNNLGYIRMAEDAMEQSRILQSRR